ncbi:protein os-9-like [Plakobranchus ocellatus]|uniref:Protein OS-9 n=1 Tax=Plakobranchus ocellatus TaxID=259542 RepID=A0AAV4D5M0_9GAST|nr:protein os-9-like [Plakobranchus ocellatus]
MEELKSVYYGLDILKEPVSVAMEAPAGAVHVTSKYGQQYQCTFPDHTSEEKRKEEEEKMAMETGIVEMLKPMGNAPCLFKAKDWWSYEFCYGKHIRQFHMEEGEIKGNIIYLGYYQEDFDWDNETAREDRLKSKTAHGRYHSQKYTLGTKCDLTGHMRRAEVRFVCEENSEDYLSRVDESETCVYTVTVVTARICRHPYLKAPVRRKPVPITCNPLLSEEQFHSYTQEMEEAKQIELKAFNKDMNSDLTKLLDQEMSDAAKELLSEPLDELFPNLDKDTSVGKDTFEKLFGSDESLWQLYRQRLQLLQKGDQEFNLKEFRKIFEDFKKMHVREKPEEREDKREMDGLSEEQGTEKPDGEKEKDEDDEILSEFDDEIKEIKTRMGNSQNSITKIKRKLTLEKTWEAELEDVIEEAEREMGVKVDRSLVSSLSNTLDKLVNKLQDTEAELASAGKELNKLKPGKPVITNKGESSAAQGNTDNEDDDEKEEEKRRINNKDGTKGIQAETPDMKIQAPPRTSPDTVVQGGADPTNKLDRPPTMEEEQEGLVGLENEREKQGQTSSGASHSDQSGVDSPSQANGDTGAADEDAEGRAGDFDEDVAELTVTLRKVDNTKPELPENVQKLLEDSIKKEYKKNRLDSDSQPLSFDTDHSFQRDRTVHVIQSEDDDGKTNRYIFVFGLNTFNDESAERQRQSAMEENYGFVYSEKKTKKSLSPGF